MKFCKAEGQSTGLPLAPNLSHDSVWQFVFGVPASSAVNMKKREIAKGNLKLGRRKCWSIPWYLKNLKKKKLWRRKHQKQDARFYVLLNRRLEWLKYHLQKGVPEWEEQSWSGIICEGFGDSEYKGVRIEGKEIPGDMWEVGRWGGYTWSGGYL